MRKITKKIKKLSCQSKKEKNWIYEKDCSVVSTRSLIQLKHVQAGQNTWSKAPRQAPLASAAVHLINNPQRPWIHEEAILHTQMQDAWVGTRSFIAGLTIASAPAWPKASTASSDGCTARSTVSLIALECTEHDEEHKSISYHRGATVAGGKKVAWHKTKE